MAFTPFGQNTATLFGAPKPTAFGNPPQQPQQFQPSSGPPGATSGIKTPPLVPPPAQAGGGHFAQPAQNPPQAQPTSNIFGQPPPSSGLFAQSTQQQQPSVFGQTRQPPQPSIFGQAQQQQPSVFGQSTQQPPSSNIFGPSQQAQPPPSNTIGSSLFGISSTTNPQNSNAQQLQQGMFGGLGNFGQNTQQQQPQNTNTTGSQPTQQGGMFGNAASLFGSTNNNSFFGNKPQQNQEQQSELFNNSIQNLPTFTKSTKFNDLPDEIKRTLENIEVHIQGRIQISKDLHQRKLGDEPTKGQGLIRGIHKEFMNTATIIRNDLHATQDIKAKVNQAVEDTIVATRVIDGFRNPQSGNNALKDHAAFPLEFFSRVAQQIKERVVWYKTTIEQIERKLATSSSQSQTPQGISATLQAQNMTFLSLASKTATLDAELQQIKVFYTQLWRAKTGSMRDPFNDLDKDVDTPTGDLGMSGLKFN